MLGTVLTPHARGTWMLIVLIGVVGRRRCRHGGPRRAHVAVGRRRAPQQRGLASGIVNAGGSVGQFAVCRWRSSSQRPRLGRRALRRRRDGAGGRALAWLLRGRPSRGGRAARSAGKGRCGPPVRDACATRLRLSHYGILRLGFHVAFIATHLPASSPPASCRLSRGVSLSLIGLFNIAAASLPAGRSGAGA